MAVSGRREDDAAGRGESRIAAADPRPAATRRRVLGATLELIAEVGFEGTSIEAVAERSGVARSTIYRHWPDPTALYLEAFDPPNADAAPPPPTGDAEADLRAYIQHVADRLNDDRFAAALAAQVDKARRDPAYREAHLRYAMTRNEYGIALFRRGIQDGSLDAGLDPETETDRILSRLVFERLMKYRRIEPALVDAIHAEALARCLARPGGAQHGRTR